MGLEQREDHQVRGGTEQTRRSLDWNDCLVTLADQVPDQQYRTWIAPLKLSSESDDIVLIAPNRFIRDFVHDKFYERIVDVVRNALGEPSREVVLAVQSAEGTVFSGRNEADDIDRCECEQRIDDHSDGHVCGCR